MDGGYEKTLWFKKFGKYFSIPQDSYRQGIPSCLVDKPWSLYGMF